MLNFVVSQKALRPERSVGRLREIQKNSVARLKYRKFNIQS